MAAALNKDAAVPSNEPPPTPAIAATNQSSVKPESTPETSDKKGTLKERVTAKQSAAPPTSDKGDDKKPNKKPDVSGLEFWAEGDMSNPSVRTDEEKGVTKYLSYTVFLAITILGGFFGLDHLYIRSPQTFAAKFMVNIFCFGIWWVWDIAQALFNEPVVRIYGLSIPGIGYGAPHIPAKKNAVKEYKKNYADTGIHGIGAGVLAEEKPDPKHWRFFIYGLALSLGGIIGMDSFLVGDRRMGFFRLICTVTVILLPISLLLWGIKLIDFFCNTAETVSMYTSFFGGAGPGSFGEFFSEFLMSIIGPVIKPLREIIDPVKQSYDMTIELADDVVLAGEGVAETVKTVVDAASKASSALPVTSLYSAVTTPALEAAKQTGGSNQDPNNIKLLPYTIIGTILLIFISGLYKNFTIKKNVAQDDSPPEPRPVRSTT